MSTTSPIMQETHYDPWGLVLEGIGFQYGGIKANRYLFNGKELIEDNGLQYYDYGARFYDPALGRWFVVDAASELFYSWTPYKYSLNNPVLFVDPDGNCETCVAFLRNTAQAISQSAYGFANAVSSNNTTIPSLSGGTVSIVDRHYSSSQAFQIGQTAGDAFSLVQGAAESVAGAIIATGGAAGGIVTSPTGVGAVAGGAVAAGGVAITAHGANTFMNAANNLLKSEGTNSQDTGQGRGKNNRTRDDNATGNHSVINENGHTTYKVNNNNPNKNSQGVGFETQKRVDYKGNAHVDKATGQKIETPHVQENGTVRPATNSDLPKKHQN